MSDHHDERKQVMAAIDDIEARFRAEHDRHRSAMAAMREELRAQVLRADELGVSLTAMSKSLKASRGRIKAMLDKLRP